MVRENQPTTQAPPQNQSRRSSTEARDADYCSPFSNAIRRLIGLFESNTDQNIPWMVALSCGLRLLGSFLNLTTRTVGLLLSTTLSNHRTLLNLVITNSTICWQLIDLWASFIVAVFNAYCACTFIIAASFLRIVLCLVAEPQCSTECPSPAQPPPPPPYNTDLETNWPSHWGKPQDSPEESLPRSPSTDSSETGGALLASTVELNRQVRGQTLGIPVDLESEILPTISPVLPDMLPPKLETPPKKETPPIRRVPRSPTVYFEYHDHPFSAYPRKRPPPLAETDSDTTSVSTQDEKAERFSMSPTSGRPGYLPPHTPPRPRPVVASCPGTLSKAGKGSHSIPDEPSTSTSYTTAYPQKTDLPAAQNENTRPLDGAFSTNLRVPKSRTLNVLANITQSLSRSSLASLGSSRNVSHSSTNTNIRESSTFSRLSSRNSFGRSARQSLEENQAAALRASNPRFISTPQPFSYWSGRFMALHDRFHGELLTPFNLQSVIDAQTAQSTLVNDPAPTPKQRKGNLPASNSKSSYLRSSLTGTSLADSPSHGTFQSIARTDVSLLLDETNRCKRVFLHLEAMCTTSEAKRSLFLFQQDYARKHNRKALLPTGGTMVAGRQGLVSRIFSGGKSQRGFMNL
ncbi:uncharacterized protein E0L32_001213 [Thyridium curvatum]|uniref:Uncharacterized protein n=1 Tax=Thyridium curvatum TaxID=1093900 RepID=A0A507ATI9_9PEZI|nr:uncharacterized protein E0L32_001213 [Thyridium curvatum]TPX10016.1 hypothetical protein E0L32_001213 [Thyridium curvatum]